MGACCRGIVFFTNWNYHQFPVSEVSSKEKFLIFYESESISFVGKMRFYKKPL